MLEQREEHQPSIRSNTYFGVADRSAQDSTETGELNTMSGGTPFQADGKKA
jgi:hypothetical protein